MNNITTIEEANRYIKEEYLPRHNEQFSVKPASDKRAFVPWVSVTTALEDILCLEETRTVRHDNTIKYKGLVLQIPKNEYRSQYIKAEVRVHEYLDHQLAIFYGPLCIGRYDANGSLKHVETSRALENAVEDNRDLGGIKKSLVLNKNHEFESLVHGFI